MPKSALVSLTGLRFGLLLLPLLSACDNNAGINLKPPGAPANAAVGPAVPPPPPGSTPSAVPPAAIHSPPAAPLTPVVNEHPDLVKFSYDWTPRGPYSQDHRHNEHPATPQDNERIVGEVIASLSQGSGDIVAQEQALARLKNTYLSEGRRAEVSALLEPLLASPSKRVQILAVSQCSTWGTTQNLPALAGLASQDDPYLSNYAAHDIYCITKDLSQVGKYLALKNARWGASRAFQEARAGEEHIWPLLDSPDPEVAAFACATLYHVGTAQSAARLGALKQHSDPNISGAARAAIQGIQRRAGG